MMVAGSLFLIFIVFGNSMIRQGVLQWQQRQSQTRIAYQMDAWTESVIRETSLQETNPGWHEKEVTFSPQKVLTLRWKSESHHPRLQEYYFELHDGTNRQSLHSWQTARFQ